MYFRFLARHYPYDYIYPRTLGDMLRINGNFSKAAKLYDLSLRLDPSNSSATRICELNHTGVKCYKCDRPIVGIRYSKTYASRWHDNGLGLLSYCSSCKQLLGDWSKY